MISSPIEEEGRRSQHRPVAAPPPPPRLDSVDLLRGVVMVLMVLDHTRDFFGDPTVNPTDLARTTPALFLTRWVTHFCAPVFAFLAGAGAYLAGRRGMDRPALAWFLLTRGLWLVFLEQTVEKFGITFDARPGFFLGLVLWSLGWSMVVLAGLVGMGRSSRAIAAAGVLMIVTHNLADGIRAERCGAFRPLVVLLHEPGLIALPRGMVLLAGYPLIPWVGVVMAGFGFGEILGWDEARRRRTLLRLGLGLTAAFLVLRGANVHGDPRPWSRQASLGFVLLSFLDGTKYPPSLLYLLMTLGPAIASLAWLERGKGPLATVLVTLGRVPLFYYLWQWYVIHGLAILLATARGLPAVSPLGPTPAEGSGPQSVFGLPAVYLLWALVVVLLYAPCRWFAGVKRRHRNVGWLGYF